MQVKIDYIPLVKERWIEITSFGLGEEQKREMLRVPNTAITQIMESHEVSDFLYRWDNVEIDNFDLMAGLYTSGHYATCHNGEGIYHIHKFPYNHYHPEHPDYQDWEMLDGEREHRRSQFRSISADSVEDFFDVGCMGDYDGSCGGDCRLCIYHIESVVN